MEYAEVVIIFMPQAIYQQQSRTVCKQWHTDILKQVSAALLLPNAFAPIYCIKNLDDIKISALLNITC